jgi:hypothetical protein
MSTPPPPPFILLFHLILQIFPLYLTIHILPCWYAIGSVCVL